LDSRVETCPTSKGIATLELDKEKHPHAKNSRNLPYFKRDCDMTLEYKSQKLSYHPVETCPTSKGIAISFFLNHPKLNLFVETCPTSKGIAIITVSV